MFFFCFNDCLYFCYLFVGSATFMLRISFIFVKLDVFVLICRLLKFSMVSVIFNALNLFKFFRSF